MFRRQVEERLPGCQRGGARRRDHHELRARKKPPDKRTHDACVQAVDRVDPHQQAVRHAFGHIADGAGQARHQILAQLAGLWQARFQVIRDGFAQTAEAGLFDLRLQRWLRGDIYFILYLPESGLHSG